MIGRTRHYDSQSGFPQDKPLKMFQYLSNTGGSTAVDFEQAILDGFASDGGFYVPASLPQVTVEQLESWKKLSYTELAFEILSLFIAPSIVSEKELKQLLKTAYAAFEKKRSNCPTSFKIEKGYLYHGVVLWADAFF